MARDATYGIDQRRRIGVGSNVHGIIMVVAADLLELARLMMGGATEAEVERWFDGLLDSYRAETDD